MATEAVQKAAAGAKSILQSRWFWFTVMALLLALVAWKYGKDIVAAVEKFFQKSYGHEGDDPQLSDGDKRALEALAQSTYDAIYSLGGMGTGSCDKLLALNDRALKYLAGYYKKALTRGKSLYQDIDDEVLWTMFTDKDEQIMGRLKALKEY